MNKASKFLLLALSLSLAACGGPSASKTPADTSAKPALADSATVAVGEPASPQLPVVPSTPAEAPAGLTATFTAGNPNAQITQIGTFVDAVMPGMAAFLTPQTLMQQVEGLLGVVGLRGLDLNQPFHMIMLDDQSALLVATIASEAELTESLAGTRTMALTHDGFAAIGKFDALQKAGPYAVSNLAKADVPELPTVALHLGNIMRGPHAPMVRQQLKNQMNDQSGAVAAEIMLDIMSSIEVLSMNLDANQQSATVRLIGEGITGQFKEFLGKQSPSSFAMFDRIGTGPWTAAMGGKLDLTPFLPHLVHLGETQAEPFLTHIAAQLGGLHGEMGVGVNAFPKREFVVGVDVANGQALGQLVDTLLGLMGKEKDLDMAGMKGQLKKGSINTRGGSLHEIKLTPTTDELKKHYGKSGVSAFFGVVADSLLVTFGPSAKVHARTLAAKSGSLGGKGNAFAKTLVEAKSLGESFVMAFDILSLQNDRAPSDVEPLVIGAGFTADSFTGRLVIPASLAKEAAQGAM